MAASDPVSVPRWLLVGGGIALTGSLLALAFVAGRATAPEAPAPVVVRAPDAAPAPQPSAAAVAAPAAPTAASTAAATDRTPADAAPALAAPSPEPAPTADPTDAAVIAYLDALDAALETRNAGADPESLAQSVVADALSGQTGSIDQLLAATEGARARARALSPPPPAANLHRDTLTLLDQTLRVYGALRDGIAAGDLAALSGLQGDASALERAARAVDLETRRLRSAHGG
jgi:hypothetical protein